MGTDEIKGYPDRSPRQGYDGKTTSGEVEQKHDKVALIVKAYTRIEPWKSQVSASNSLHH